MTDNKSGWKTQLVSRYASSDRDLCNAFVDMGDVSWNEACTSDQGNVSRSFGAQYNLAKQLRKHMISESDKLGLGNTIWLACIMSFLRDVNWMDLADEILKKNEDYDPQVF